YPKPYTPHPTPYTLHPTPCTLHPAPYTLHPKPPNPKPYTPQPHNPHPNTPTPNQAATLLRNLSVNDENKNRIAQAGGLAPLIILLSSPLPRIQEQVLSLIPHPSTLNPRALHLNRVLPKL
ncbi:hypothetical protein T484DRAFT_1642372, partial [Baffinella frigidus]